MAIDQPRAYSTTDHHRLPVHSRGDGNPISIMAPASSATPISSDPPDLPVTTPGSRLTARHPQIPIGVIHGSGGAMPARGFLP